MIVFTDLDGTLLDHDTYSFEPALPAITALQEKGIPLVLVTSKTRAEVEELRKAMGIRDPFIVENGGALILSEHEEVTFGSRRTASRAALLAAAADTGVSVRAFGDMTVEEIAERAQLPVAAARLASQREYGEPFLVLGPGRDRLFEHLRTAGFTVKEGGRFFHVSQGCDKSKAVAALSERLGDPETVGLGDAPNDIDFLRAARISVIIPSRHLDHMRDALPQARIAQASGPAGWNRAVLDILAARTWN